MYASVQKTTGKRVHQRCCPGHLVAAGPGLVPRRGWFHACIARSRRRGSPTFRSSYAITFLPGPRTGPVPMAACTLATGVRLCELPLMRRRVGTASGVWRTAWLNLSRAAPLAICPLELFSIAWRSQSAKEGDQVANLLLREVFAPGAHERRLAQRRAAFVEQ